jgi:transcriptional accessory protein Tex/SPT6
MSLPTIAFQLFLQDPSSTGRAEWDAVRAKVLDNAINRHMIPAFEKELRQELMRTAKEHVAIEATDTMKELLNVGPFLAPATINEGKIARENGFYVPEETDGSAPYKGCKVVAINVNEEMQVANYAVALDHDGHLIDHLILPPIPDARNENERTNFEKTICNFVIAASSERDQVHAIVVNSSAGPVSRKMIELVTEMVDTRLLEDLRNMVNEDSDDEDEQDEHVEPHVLYSYVDDQVAQIYANSPRAAREFPDYPGTLRQAIALGRYLQDPLDELCSLWIEGAGKKGEEAKELRMLTIHPLQVCDE